MRKQGSLLVVLVAACVCLLGACSSSDNSSSTTTESRGNPTTAVSGDTAGDAEDVAKDCTARGPDVDLHNCNLSEADLSEADLSGGTTTRAVDLTDASLYGADLNESFIWDNTTCPNGVVLSTPCA